MFTPLSQKQRGFLLPPDRALIEAWVSGHAAMRAEAMLEAGDLDGYAVWKRVLRAVEELRETKPEPGARAH